MKSSKELKKQYPNILLLGESGCGKTEWIGSMIDAGYKPAVIDTEKGLTTIKNRKFDYETVNTFTEFEKAVQGVFENHKNYTHLVVDSFSRLSQYLLVELAGDDAKVDRDAWGVALAKQRKIIDVLTKNCPLPVIVTSTVSESKDEVTGMTKLFPAINGSFKFDLATYFDCVFYLQSGLDKSNKAKYWMRTVGDHRIIAKSRLQGMAPIEASSCAIVDKLLK